MLAPDPPMTRSSACHHATALSVADPLEFWSYQEMPLALLAVTALMLCRWHGGMAVVPPGAAALAMRRARSDRQARSH